MIKYVRSIKGINRYKKLILKYHLHNVYGTMSDWCRDDSEKIDMIAVYYLDEIPIGAMILLKEKTYQDCNIGVYIIPDFRRNKYGSKLVKCAKAKGKVEIFPWIEIHSAKSFYGSCLDLTGQTDRV
jgi:GNAT superfamily N-acetyltransferase